MARDPNLDTTARRRAIANCAAVHPPICHLCGNPINPRLPRGTHPLSWTADDLTPRSRGGRADDITNLRPAHRACNGYRQDRPITPALVDACKALYERHSKRLVTGTRTW